MAEIEIATTGEILLHGDAVGHITWARPYIEADVAGTYDDYGQGYDEFGDFMGCSDCDDKDAEIDDLEVKVHKLEGEIVTDKTSISQLKKRIEYLLVSA